MLNWYEGLAKRAMQRPGIHGGSNSWRRRAHIACAFPVPWARLLSRAPILANSSSMCGCPAARGWKSATITSPRLKHVIRSVVKPSDLDMVVSNIGVYPDLSAIYTTNASMNTAFVQVSLKEDHSVASYEYMQRVQETLSREMPELTTYFQAGGLVDGVVNQGLPAPIDIQVSSMDMDGAYALAKDLSQKIKSDAECERRLHSAGY